MYLSAASVVAVSRVEFGAGIGVTTVTGMFLGESYWRTFIHTNGSHVCENHTAM